MRTHYLKNDGKSACGRQIRNVWTLAWSWCWGSVDCKQCLKKKGEVE